MCAPPKRMIQSPQSMRRGHPKNLQRAQHVIAIPRNRKARPRHTPPRLRLQIMLPQHATIRILLQQLRPRILLCRTRSPTLRNTQVLRPILRLQAMTGLWAITRISHHMSALASFRQLAPFRRTITPLTVAARTHTTVTQARVTELWKLPTDPNLHIHRNCHRMQAIQIRRTSTKAQATTDRGRLHIRSRTHSKLSQERIPRMTAILHNIRKTPAISNSPVHPLTRTRTLLTGRLPVRRRGDPTMIGGPTRIRASTVALRTLHRPLDSHQLWASFR